MGRERSALGRSVPRGHSGRREAFGGPVGQDQFQP